MNDLKKMEGFEIQAQNKDDAWQMCQNLAQSDLIPKQYKGRPHDIFTACTMGAELGLGPFQAMKGIAVVNGSPTVWGDTMLGICQSDPEFGDVEERHEGEGDERVAVCIVTRKGRSPLEGRFSVADAKRAKLWGKQGPWSAYPDRMLMWRARSFAYRGAFPDKLAGMHTQEEMIGVHEVKDAEVISIDDLEVEATDEQPSNESE